MTTAADLSRVRRGRVLTAAEQERAFVLFGRGLSRDEVIRKLRISKATWQNTIAEVETFRAAWETAQAGRLQEVELTAYKLALGGMKTVKLVYHAQLSKDGTPVRDDEGRPKMILNKREVTISPPNWDAVKFILMARMHDTYGTKALAHEHNVESLDTLRALLEAKLKAEVGKAAPPPIALPPAEQGGSVNEDDEATLGVLYLRRGEMLVRHNVVVLQIDEVTEDADTFERWRFVLTNLDDMHFVRTAHQDTR